MARTTDKRETILRFITDFMRNQGYPPSVREICAGVGLASTATVHYHLNALKEKEPDDLASRRAPFRLDPNRRRGHSRSADPSRREY